MIFLDINGWQYIVSNKSYDKIGFILELGKGNIYVYVYKSEGKQPSQFSIGGRDWIRIKRIIDSEYRKNFKKIDNWLENKKLTKLVKKKREYFGYYQYLFYPISSKKNRNDIFEIKNRVKNVLDVLFKPEIEEKE